MKRLLFLLVYLLIMLPLFSQSKSSADSVPSYIRNAYMPSFSIYKAPDSSTFTNENMVKGKPVVLMIFSPDCGHCQMVAKEILENMDHFKNAEILMTTWLPYSEMLTFYNDYKIANYPEITMAWDSKYFFLPYYQVQMYPKLIVYNKQGKFVKEYSGNIKIDEVWKAL